MDNKARVKKITKRLGLRGNDNSTEYYRVGEVRTDLRHFCDAKGIDFDQETDTSITFYESERENEKETA